MWRQGALFAKHALATLLTRKETVAARTSMRIRMPALTVNKLKLLILVAAIAGIHSNAGCVPIFSNAFVAPTRPLEQQTCIRK